MKARGFPWTEVVVLLLAACVVLLIAYAGYRQQAANAPRYDTLSTYDAHSGGYRAWYELMQREGARVERFERRPAFLDASVGTLIASPNRTELALRNQETGDATGAPQAIDLENLRTWVKNGGRLVWVTDGTWDSRLGVAEPSDKGPERDEAVRIVLSPLTAGVVAVSGTSELRVPFGDSASGLPLVADGGGSVVTTYTLGKGTIIVVTDQSLFTNNRIAKAENARLAYALAGGGSGAVAFDEYVHGYAAGGSWWTILPVPVRIAFVIVLVGVLALLVASTLRFGPTARLPEDAERTSAEYLSSVAALLARGHAARKALRDLVNTTLQDVAHGVGMSERASLGALASRLRFGEIGTQRADELIELDRLGGLDQPSDKDLVRAAWLSASLRKEFSRYGRIGFGRRAAPVRRPA
jgi:hypothetical protein